MKKIWIISSVAIITMVFVYAMIILSNNNTCTWVRVFDCQKNQVPTAKFNELKPTWDIFLKYCAPKIIEGTNTYILDYSSCDLKVNILKEKSWVDSVNVNGNSLTRDEINASFK